MNFERAYAILSSLEGGFSDRSSADDPGDMTKFGISKKAYPNEDIKNLTQDRAKFLTKRDYWDTIGGDFMQWPLALITFDMAFNSGVKPAIKMLQQSLGLTPDGVIGPLTIGAATKVDFKSTVVDFMFRRFCFMIALGNWNANKNGWMHRLFTVAVAAVT